MAQPQREQAAGWRGGHRGSRTPGWLMDEVWIDLCSGNAGGHGLMELHCLGPLCVLQLSPQEQCVPPHGTGTAGLAPAPPGMCPQLGAGKARGWEQGGDVP